MMSPYTRGFDLVRKHPGTSGQIALAKCILSLYDPCHAFSAGEVLWSLDREYTDTVLAMLAEYAERGETEELRQAGRWVYQNFPCLIELSDAMRQARIQLALRKEAGYHA
jgi:hypothetical protein